MSPTPTITVALATYQRAALVPAAIDRVLAQTYDDFELVVVDDGSTDDTAAVAEAAAGGDPRVRVVRRPNGGISAARNTGAAEARGRWIVFLDDDDEPLPHWLVRLAEAVTAADAAVASCAAELVDPSGTVLAIERPRPLGPLWGNATALVLAGTFAVRRDAFDACGGYVEGLQCSHQTELALRLLPLCEQRGWPVVSVDEPLLRIRRRGADDRPESTPAKLLSGTTYLLEAHRDRLRGHPHALANWSAVAGVAAARLGDRRTARRHLWRALRVRPSLRNAARLAAATTPPVARRVWGR